MARRTTSPRRYAEALFEVAERSGSVDAWHDEVQRAADVLGAEEVAPLLENPGLPYARRQELVERALAGVSPGVRNLALLLLQRGRLDALPRVAREFHRLVNARAGISEGTVTSAAPLQPAESDALRRRLEEMTGGRVELSYQVDPALLGGVVVRLGDRLIDGSVRGRLERLRSRLTAGAL